jgi:hypothetical protein
MFKCPGCSKANNIYALNCAHCGVALTPPEDAPKPTCHVREPCPKCSHGRFLVVASVAVPDATDTWRLVTMPVVCGHVGDVRESAGTFHAYVCLSCGYTEWYATSLPALEKLASRVPGTRVIEVTPPPAYR